MKIVPLNEVKNRFSTYLELAKREDIVVTKNGRPAAILHAVTDADIEDYLFEPTLGSSRGSKPSGESSSG